MAPIKRVGTDPVARFFELSPLVFHLCFLFILSGLVVALFADLQLGIAFIWIQDAVGIPIMIALWVLGSIGILTRNIAVGASMILGIYLFFISLIPSEFPIGHIELQFFYMMNLVISFVIMSGFLVDKRLSLIVGGATLIYSIWMFIRARSPFMDNNFPVLAILILGVSVLVYYYRGKLESLVMELMEQKKATEDALAQVKIAQKQIVHQEKMASLGALTAGIAHEIKNPLNFVNNFAESSKELMLELKEHLDAKREAFDTQSASDVEYLLSELAQNMNDIANHGKRGNAIVQNMLLHSRGGESLLHMTDVNELVREAANLAYHGYRAREPDFRAELAFDLDPSVGQVPIVGHEINRVILNIINNALYAGHKKVMKGLAAQALVRLSTKRIKGEDIDKRGGYWLEIRILDNGEGIAPEEKDRIFMPFFTTKPTGEGTGLGLSISYEIVTVGHRGDLSVETEQGSYAEFVIHLPYDQPVESRSASAR